MRLTIKLMNGELIEQSVDSDVVVIGRSAKCTVQIPHEGMSRQHCQLEVVNGEIFVTDLNSTNGVFIDNNRIEPNQRVPYNTFFQLSFGAVQNLQIDLEELDSPQTQQKAKPLIKEDVRQHATPRPRQNPFISNSNNNRKKDNKVVFWILNAIVAGVILFFVFWFLGGNEEQNPEYYESADEIPTTDPNGN